MAHKIKSSPKIRSNKTKEDKNNYVDETAVRSSKKAKKNSQLDVFGKYIWDYIAIISLASVVIILKLYSSYQDSSETTIYDFTVKNIYGNNVDLSIYRGHVVVIVNVATTCTYANDNIEVLTYVNKLKINGKPIRILAFSCDQFGNQESGNSVNVMKLMKDKRAPFDLFENVDVKGENAHPLFKFLENDFGEIKWNYYKYIIDQDGVPIRRFSSEADFYKISSALQENFNVDEA